MIDPSRALILERLSHHAFRGSPTMLNHYTLYIDESGDFGSAKTLGRSCAPPVTSVLISLSLPDEDCVRFHSQRLDTLQWNFTNRK